MARPFSPATAEQVIAAVEAVVANSAQPIEAEFVANFIDLPKDKAEAALNLATDIGFLSHTAGTYKVSSPLCRFVVTPNQIHKAAALRVLLESFDPFLIFRERLIATNQTDSAAHQTKVTLDLDAHRENIKDTLISLGTYGQVFFTEGGGRYRLESPSLSNLLEILAQACVDISAAEAKVRLQIGHDAAAEASRDEVIVPLADALLRANQNDPSGAIQSAGNAIESYLVMSANVLGVNLTGATGINSKLDKFEAARKLPKKLIWVGKYIGHTRNAADHGVDSEIGTSWAIREVTGIEYVSIACSFVATTTAYWKGNPPII